MTQKKQDKHAISPNWQSLFKQHYENFPVASFLLPKDLRHPISVIYAFARMADDLADEGDLTKEERLERLSHFSEQLEKIEQEEITPHDFWQTLKNVIEHYELPIQLFHDLLYAFKQDVLNQRFQTFEDILEYCRYSANPIGQLILYLTKNMDGKNKEFSDAICTALQLINFIQDIKEDINERGRLYFPMRELQKFEADPKGYILNLLDTCEKLLKSGYPLINLLSGRLKWEIKTIYYSGLRMIHKLKKRPSIFERPTLNLWDKIVIGCCVIFK